MSTLPLIHGMTRVEVTALCKELGQPSYRAGQIWKWLYQHWTMDWVDMKNVPQAMRDALASAVSLNSAVPAKTDQETTVESTRKILVALQDGECVEEVLIPAPGRHTVCVSSQVGCKFRCAFCASGQSGFQRNLQVGEMVGQVVAAARLFGDSPSNVVFMGIGEPFDNYEAVLAAVRIINDHDGLNIGARHITISTSGVIPGIRRLSDEGIQVELSVSLHAPEDALRSRLMPVNRTYPLAALMAACREYAEKTKRLITFEYTLIQGVNDSRAHAKALVQLLQSLHSRVNLIPLSPVAEFDGLPPTPEVSRMFINELDYAHINATLRISKGCGINAACGQLRRTRMDDGGL